MSSRFNRTLYSCVLAVAMTVGCGASAAAQTTVKVAFWNIMSGKGVDALPGYPAPFVNTSNCTDATQPLNAWGVGASQTALQNALSDPSVVALGLAESWSSVCGSPEHVRQALGWAAHTSEQNGVSLVARYGVAGAEQWQQLDTSMNTNPGDTMWVLRVPVCANSACTQTLLVYVGHWYGTGTYAQTSYDNQAKQTASFLQATSGGKPHVFVGDLNTWEGTTTVCNQNPNNSSLGYLRNAGYYDAWLTIHGSAEGYTGMANRAGCGNPEGYTWKRIDYAWSLPTFQPLDIQRWGNQPPGYASPSDHYGIIVTLPYPGTTSTTTSTSSTTTPVTSTSTTTTTTATTVSPTDVAWTSLVNATASGASLQKTSGCTDCFDAGAISAQQLTDGSTLTFTVGGLQRQFVGLGTDTSASTNYANINYAFSFWGNGTYEIRESNTYRTEGSYGASDVFKMTVQGTTVTYYKNGSIVYTSKVAVPGPLVVDTSMQTIGALAKASVASATATTSPTMTTATTTTVTSNNVAWTQLVNTALSGTTLTKTTGCGDCFDAGAVGQQVGSGHAVAFGVTAGQRLVIGLGTDTSASTSYAINYAFSFWQNGTWEIREGGTYRTEGQMAAGDVYRIAVSGTTVQYYRNGTLVYTSQVPVPAPVVVDSSLNTIGAAVTNAIVQ
jgi:hypothetical protein